LVRRIHFIISTFTRFIKIERMPASIELQVKSAIISAGGLVGSTPENLDDKLDLANDLHIEGITISYRCRQGFGHALALLVPGRGRHGHIGA
jgi:hypothetical protein